MHGAVLQRVIPFARNADAKISGSGESEGERAGGIGLRFLRWSTHASAANGRVVFVDNAAVESHVGVNRKKQTRG